tara:strand:+ start:554 stop:1033 length:480 start_codon:yes stop_codon:yes gene_type:complete
MKDFFNNVYKVLIEKRTDFSGRASRNEYWSSWFFIQLTSIFLLIFAFRARPLFLIFIIFSIFIIIPSLAVTVRRLHDVNKSGYWLIVPLPLIFISYLSLFLFSLFSPENQSDGSNFFQIISLVTYITGIFMASLWYCFPIFMFLTQSGDKDKNRYGDPN